MDQIDLLVFALPDGGRGDGSSAPVPGRGQARGARPLPDSIKISDMSFF
jgi:hypothetical protein